MLYFVHSPWSPSTRFVGVTKGVIAWFIGPWLVDRYWRFSLTIPGKPTIPDTTNTLLAALPITFVYLLHFAFSRLHSWSAHCPTGFPDSWITPLVSHFRTGQHDKDCRLIYFAQPKFVQHLICISITFVAPNFLYLTQTHLATFCKYGPQKTFQQTRSPFE